MSCPYEAFATVQRLECMSLDGVYHVTLPIAAISNRTGAPVHIRVGGTSGDFASYAPQQDAALKLPTDAKAGGIPKGITIGPSWYEGFGNFQGVKWTYMVHFAHLSEVANAVADVQQALHHIGPNLESLEIGNEIDFYPGVNRAESFNIERYQQQWHQYESAITKATGPKMYQGPVFANNNWPFCIASAFNSGQDSSKNIKSAALHHYMDSAAVSTTDIQFNYMNHSRIVSQMSKYQLPIAYLKTNYPKIPLYLAEVNSNTYSTNNYDVLGTFGNTLWLIDFMMYGMVLGVKRMNIQQSTGFSYASWRGVEYDGLPAAVLPPFYAHPFVVDVIGSDADNIRVTDLRLVRDDFAGYGIYSSGTLRKIVLINLERYDSATGVHGRSHTVSLKLDGTNGRAKVEKLTAPGAEVQDAEKISWKGDSWTFGSNGIAVQGAATTEDKQVSGGMLSVIVLASEAVLVTLA